jgi:hypothetical protein
MVIKRLADLERVLPSRETKHHQITVQPGEDADAQIADLITSGKAKKGDKFIVRRIVDPIPEMPGSASGSLIQ